VRLDAETAQMAEFGLRDLPIRDRIERELNSS